MRNDIPPKQSQNVTREARADWPAARIVYELKLRGMSLRRLALANGLAGRTLWNVTRSRWPRGEQIVARALRKSPAEIWPSRYLKNAKRQIRKSVRRSA
jgi:Ner family transcriptional regulator